MTQFQVVPYGARTLPFYVYVTPRSLQDRRPVWVAGVRTPCVTAVRVHPAEFAGATVGSKLATLARELDKAGADALVAASLDEVAYLFIDAQSDNDTSSFAWFVNGTYVGNSSTYTAELSNGSVISVRLTPFDGLYTGEVVEAELQILTEDDV